MFSIFSKDPKDLFKKCEQCNNPVVCEANLKVMKDESKAKDWYLSIGSQSAGKIVAALGSLDKSKQIRLESSDAAVALDILKSLANELDWCTGNCEGAESKLKFDVIGEEIGKCLKCKRDTFTISPGLLYFDIYGFNGISAGISGSNVNASLLKSLADRFNWCVGLCDDVAENKNPHMVELRLTVTKFGKLVSVKSPDFQLGNATCNLKVFRKSNHLGISLKTNKSFTIRAMISLLGINDNTKTIRNLFTKDVTAGDDSVLLNELISWYDLLLQNTFVQYNSITIVVKMWIKNEAMKPLPLECLICFANIETQEISSVACGHIFCTKCIEKSLTVKQTCPVCNEAANLKDLRRTCLSI